MASPTPDQDRDPDRAAQWVVRGAADRGRHLRGRRRQRGHFGRAGSGAARAQGRAGRWAARARWAGGQLGDRDVLRVLLQRPQRLPDGARHRGRHPARSRRAGRAAFPARRAVEHDRGAVRRGRARALDRARGRGGRDHRAARRGDARGDARRAAHPRDRSRDALRRRARERGGLRRCDRRCGARLERGPCVPRGGGRADLRLADRDHRGLRREQRADARRDHGAAEERRRRTMA